MKRIFLLLSLVLVLGPIFSQNVGISDNGSSFTPESTSLLELKSTSKGILIPRMTYAQREAISSPSEGLLIYQTDFGVSGQGFYYNNSSTSTANWVYICNSETSQSENYQIIKSVSDFPDPVTGVITLADNTTYEINGNVNLGSNTITFGSNSSIVGNNKFVDKITYTGNGNLFNMGDVNAIIKGITITASTSGSNVFNSNGSNNLIQVFDNMFLGCNDLGTFNGGFAVNINNCAMQGCSDGVTFSGSLQHVFYNSNKHCTNTGTNLYIPSGSFYSIQIQNNYFDISSGHTGLNILASTASVDDAKILNNFFHGDGTYVSGVTTSYSSWFFMGNTKLEDSNPFGYLAIIENSTATTVASKNTYYKVAGNNYTSSVELFDTNGVNNRLRYTGSKPLNVEIKCSGELISTNSNKNVWIAIYKNGSQKVCYTRIKPRNTIDSYSFSIEGKTTLTNEDYLEAYVMTQGTGFNVTVTDMQFKVDN